MPSGDRSGRELERLVAMLERVFAGSNAEIEAPSRRLLDRDTGKLREHDVVIVWDHGHHRIITAVECRNRSRPVGVPDVEAFADKCEATGVHSGAMVSASGFRATARAKAAARSITCMDLAEVERFDWLGTETIVAYERQFGDMDIRLVFKGSQPESVSAVSDTEGNELTADQIASIVRNAVAPAADPDEEVGKQFPVKVRINTPDWTVRDFQGELWPLDHILAKSSFVTLKSISPVRSHRYKGGGKDYAFASADAKIGNVLGKVIFLRNDDDSTDIFWTSDTNADTRSKSGIEQTLP